MITAKIIVDISTSAVDKVFDYLIPSNMSLREGDRVKVPFGNKVIEGFCIDIREIESTEFKLKYVAEVLDENPLIKPEMLKLMQYMKDAFYVRFVDSLRLFIPPNLRGGNVKDLVKEYAILNNAFDYNEELLHLKSNAKSQRGIINKLIEKSDGEYISVLNAEFGVSAVKALINKNYLTVTKEVVYRTPFKEVNESVARVSLTSEQCNAVNEILNNETKISLLHGVTGSGKTEVYLSLIDKVLENGKTAIMLVPEISLTPQMLRIFRSRYGDEVAMLHSGLSKGERFDEWRRLFSGTAKVAIGARSAIFAPLDKIGVIIVDEEHDQSYISDNNPRYNAIDVAKFRAKHNNAHLILGSATPSLESYNNAIKGKYKLVSMAKRITDRGLPSIEIVDMANELRQGNFGVFSRELEQSMSEETAKGNQVMIFLNRRGFASYLMCRECGYVPKCTDCDITLTLHTEENVLKCHYCNKKYKVLTKCPICGSEKLRQGKVGTEKLVEEIEQMLPNVKVLRMDNDTVTTKNSYMEILGAFRKGEAQVLVGTQMIAKGHDFPDVTLVGVLDADMSLYYSNYLSNEKTFQLITQVAGRAGRSDKAGKVVIQTYTPKHFIFNYIRQNNYVGFFDKEINTRELSNFPPFTTIVRVLIRSEVEQKAVEQAKLIFNDIKIVAKEFEKEFVYCQAMKAPLTKLEKMYRYQIIMRIRRPMEELIIGKIHKAIKDNVLTNAVVFVELNPSDMR